MYYVVQWAVDAALCLEDDNCEESDPYLGTIQELKIAVGSKLEINCLSNFVLKTFVFHSVEMWTRALLSRADSEQSIVLSSTF